MFFPSLFDCSSDLKSSDKASEFAWQTKHLQITLKFCTDLDIGGVYNSSHEDPHNFASKYDIFSMHCFYVLSSGFYIKISASEQNPEVPGSIPGATRFSE
jgi:hypothetical protein